MRNTPLLQSAANTTSQNLPAIPVNQVFGISVLAVQGDTTAAGTVKLQASNDEAPAGQMAGFTPTNWVDITNSSQTVTAGSAILIPFTQLCYQWVRVVWTAGTDGTSTITAYINSQSV